jgi:hypothetical protein
MAIPGSDMRIRHAVMRLTLLNGLDFIRLGVRDLNAELLQKALC